MWSRERNLCRSWLFSRVSDGDICRSCYKSQVIARPLFYISNIYTCSLFLTSSLRILYYNGVIQKMLRNAPCFRNIFMKKKDKQQNFAFAFQFLAPLSVVVHIGRDEKLLYVTSVFLVADYLSHSKCLSLLYFSLLYRITFWESFSSIVT